MSAFWQALLSGQRAVVAGPLRTLRYDDQDTSFFTYTGTWYVYRGGDWGGGAYGNTVTYRAAVVPSEAPLPLLVTKVIPFSGTPEEGIIFWGAAEDGGQIVFFIRALDSKTNAGWVQFGPSFGTYTTSWQWNTTNRPDNRPEADANYAGSFIGQSYYSRLSNPGIVRVHGLPAGRYQFMLQKPANTTDPGDNGNKAFYFDGATVETCHPTFS